MRERFEKGDQNLYSLKFAAGIIATILIIASIIVGIVMIASAAELSGKSSSYYASNAASTTGIMTGLVFLIVVPLLIWFGYRFVMYFIWLSFDIKIIRNKLLGLEDTDAMLDICPLPRKKEHKKDDMWED